MTGKKKKCKKERKNRSNVGCEKETKRERERQTKNIITNLYVHVSLLFSICIINSHTTLIRWLKCFDAGDYDLSYQAR